MGELYQKRKGLTGHITNLLLGAQLGYSPRQFMGRMVIYGAAFSMAAVFLFIGEQPHITAIAALIVFVLFEFAVYIILSTMAKRRIDAIEAALPEFLGIMASNIRSGHTYDRALILSARKELGPLSEEIDKVSKETLTGTPLADAMQNMTYRVPSDVLEKTVNLIVKGLNSGGKLADLLEATSLDIRRFDSMKKEVSATVMVYKLFSLAAVCIGAPMLYAVTNFLIKVFADTRAKMGTVNLSEGAGNLPFFQGEAISPETTFYFSIAAIGITAFFGAMVAGVIERGDERDGLPIIPVIFLVSYAIYFFGSFVLNTLLGSFFGMGIG